MSKFSGLSKIGDDLLSEASKAMKTAADFSIVPIALNLIDPNEDNKDMSLDDIPELAQSILDNGLDQNLVVLPQSNGRYKLLTGHRRRLALLSLVEQGHTEYTQVPCLIKNLDTIHFDISEQGKEKFALMTTNIQRRTNTLKDNLALMRLADDVFDEIKQTGASIGSRREWIAEQLGVSPSTVRDLTHIQNNASPAIQKAIDKDNLPLTVATEISRMKQEEQEQLAAEQTEKLPAMSVTDIKNFKEKKAKEKAQQELESKSQPLSNNDLPYMYGKSDIDRLKDQINKCTVSAILKNGGLVLQQKEREKIIQSEIAIQKQIEKIQTVLKKAEQRYEANK